MTIPLLPPQSVSRRAGPHSQDQGLHVPHCGHMGLKATCVPLSPSWSTLHKAPRGLEQPCFPLFHCVRATHSPSPWLLPPSPGAAPWPRASVTSQWPHPRSPSGNLLFLLGLSCPIGSWDPSFLILCLKEHSPSLSWHLPLAFYNLPSLYP